jgi:hypothetical protein
MQTTQIFLLAIAIGALQANAEILSCTYADYHNSTNWLVCFFYCVL